MALFLLLHSQNWFHVKSEIEKCWIFHTVGNEWDSVNAKWKNENVKMYQQTLLEILKVSEWDSPRISTTVYSHFGERDNSHQKTHYWTLTFLSTISNGLFWYNLTLIMPSN